MDKLVKVVKLLREKDYLLEVDLTAIEREDDPWSPYFTTEQAQRLYNARAALVKGDREKAQRFGKLYRVIPADKDMTIVS
ncbi:MAG: hypothetical protein HQ591_10865 [candidate division Zixibacteria bacterium]|nr:hypothetical protein [Candidatus Tariuqbacter arcticus]